MYLFLCPGISKIHSNGCWISVCIFSHVYIISFVYSNNSLVNYELIILNILYLIGHFNIIFINKYILILTDHLLHLKRKAPIILTIVSGLDPRQLNPLFFSSEPKEEVHSSLNKRIISSIQHEFFLLCNGQSPLHNEKLKNNI